MPSVAEEPPFYGGVRATAHHGVSIASKKRRWEDARGSSDANHSSDAVVSLILDGDDLLSHKLAAVATSTVRSSIGTAPQRKIIPLANKRRRLSNCDNTLDDRHKSLTSSSTSNSATTHTSSPMLACHVCQRKPRRKSDLDTQADCEGCGQRTCFVCLRECSGWAANGSSDNNGDNTHDCEGQTPIEETSGHGLCPPSKRPQSRPWSASRRGHRRIVCSRCCVERGEDGEAVCLGCMAS